MTIYLYIFLFILYSYVISVKLDELDTITNFIGCSGQYIMMTFEDGPHHSITPMILDILKEKQASKIIEVSSYSLILIWRCY